MDPWQKESLNLQVDDFIIWQGEAIELEGQPAVVTPGMKGEVISLHDGFHLDVAEVAPIPPKAIVQFENGMRLMVDERMKLQDSKPKTIPRIDFSPSKSATYPQPVAESSLVAVLVKSLRLT